GVADTGQVGALADAGGEGDLVAAGARVGQGGPWGGADQVGGVPNHGKRPAGLAAVHGQVERAVGEPAALVLGLHVYPVSGQVPAGGERLQRLGERVEGGGHVCAALHVGGEGDLVLAGADVGHAGDAIAMGQRAVGGHAGEQVGAGGLRWGSAQRYRDCRGGGRGDGGSCGKQAPGKPVDHGEC